MVVVGDENGHFRASANYSEDVAVGATRFSAHQNGFHMMKSGHT